MSEMRDRILDAARREYLRQGTDRTTLSAIADEAGVSRPTVYKYVGDRDAIASALVEREVEVFFGLLREILESHHDARSRVVEGLAFAVRYAQGHALFQRLLRAESGVVLPRLTTEAGPILDAAIQVLQPYLVEARREGQIRRIDPRRAAEWIARTGISLILTPSPSIDADDEDQLRALLEDMFRAALSAG